MPTGIAGARIFQTFKAGDEPVHVSSSTHRIQNAVGRSDRKPTRKLKCSCQTVSNAIPLLLERLALDYLLDGGGELVDDGLRRACRGIDGGPGLQLEALHTYFCGGREVGEHRMAPATREGQAFHLVVAQVASRR